MNLDLDALGAESLSVTLNGKKYDIKQQSIGDYLKVVSMQGESWDTAEAGAALLKKAIHGFAPGVFPKDAVESLSVRQLRTLAEKLGKFQGAVDEGNREPGGA